MTQLTLFGNADEQKDVKVKTKVYKQIVVKSEQPLIKQPPSHSEEYCIKRILDEDYLWDLRCWHKDHDIDEVKAYLAKVILKEEDWKNCGHTIGCARDLLIDYGKSIDEVAELFMRNHHIQYREQLGSSYVCSKCGRDKPSDIMMQCSDCMNGGENGTA